MRRRQPPRRDDGGDSEPQSGERPENDPPSSIRRHASRTLVDRSRRTRSSANECVSLRPVANAAVRSVAGLLLPGPPRSQDVCKSRDSRRPFRIRHRNQARLLQPHRPAPRSPPAARTRIHTSANDHAYHRDAPNPRRSTANHRDRRANALPPLTTALPPLTTAIALATHLRVHRRDREFRALDHGLRVRMLTGWVHPTCERSPDRVVEQHECRFTRVRTRQRWRGPPRQRSA